MRCCDHRRLALAFVVGLASPSLLPGQLAPATALSDEEFTRILSVRELADGRVLVSDDRENRLVVVDLRSGAVRTLGRLGRGPGEFEQPDRLLATRGDSTLMRDRANSRRWTLIVGDSVAGTIPPDDPTVLATAGSLVGADSRGYVLARRPGPLADLGGGRARASSAVLRVDRATGRADTIAQVRGTTVAAGTTPSGSTTTRANFILVFSVVDQAVLFPDGWVAIAYADPYRVDWHPPNAAVVRGDPIPWTPVRVTAEEKQFWHDRMMEDAGTDRPFDFSGTPFADEIPPFRSQGLWPAPDGALLIHRERSRAAPGNDYEIIDRRGARVGTLRLPASERIVGFGAAAVYVAVKDDDGIERLRRHPWRAGAPR